MEWGISPGAFIQAIDEAAEHFGDAFYVGLKSFMPFRREQPLPGSHLRQRDAFLHAAACDAEEVLSIGFREPAVAFGDVGGDRKGRPVKLISQEGVSSWETLRQRAARISEGNCPLINNQLLKRERQAERTI